MPLNGLNLGDMPPPISLIELVLFCVLIAEKKQLPKLNFLMDCEMNAYIEPDSVSSVKIDEIQLSVHLSLQTYSREQLIYGFLEETQACNRIPYLLQVFIKTF